MGGANTSGLRNVYVRFRMTMISSIKIDRTEGEKEKIKGGGNVETGEVRDMSLVTN